MGKSKTSGKEKFMVSNLGLTDVFSYGSRPPFLQGANEPVRSQVRTLTDKLRGLSVRTYAAALLVTALLHSPSFA